MSATALSDRPAVETPPRRVPGGRIAVVAVMAGIFALAFLIRLSIMFRGGGLHGLGAYDDGVYFAAADALVHGRLPYRDFLFIQPPLIAVVTAPFAALGTLMGDPTAFLIARLAYMALGGINAVLCFAILRRFGWGAAVLGGIGYAVFYPAVYVERSVLLEPLGTTGMLVALLLLQHTDRHRWFAIAAGVAAGLATGAKIWYIVPAVLIVLAARRTHLRYVLGLAIGGCAIFLPFLLSAPQQTFQQIVLNQLGRSDGLDTTNSDRITDIVAAHYTLGIPVTVMEPILIVLSIAAVLVALATRGARVFAVLTIADLVVLLEAPSWFSHYAALTAPTLALCVGVAGGRLASLAPRRAGRIAVVAVLVLGVMVANEANDRTPYGKKIPTGLNLAANAVQGCITADDPGTLIAMNVLSRDLRNPSCAVWPDVTGWTYDPKDRRFGPDGDPLPRAENTRWQQDVVAFLESGDATIRTRSGTGLSVASKAVIDSGKVLYRNGKYVVHATHG